MMLVSFRSCPILRTLTIIQITFSLCVGKHWKTRSSITASPELKKMFCCQFQSFFRPKVLAQIEIEFLAWSRWKMEPAMKKSLSSRFLAPFLAASKGDSFRELKEVQILFFWKYEKAFYELAIEVEKRPFNSYLAERYFTRLQVSLLSQHLFYSSP